MNSAPPRLPRRPLVAFVAATGMLGLLSTTPVAEPALPLRPVADAATGEVATTLAQPLVKHLQRLNQIRRSVPALQMGQYSTDGISGSMAFKRRYTSGNTDSFALVTVTDGATYTGIPNGTYRDAVTGDVKPVSNGSLSVTAPGKGNLRVYVLNGPGKIGTDGPYLK